MIKCNEQRKNEKMKTFFLNLEGEFLLFARDVFHQYSALFISIFCETRVDFLDTTCQTWNSLFWWLFNKSKRIQSHLRGTKT